MARFSLCFTLIVFIGVTISLQQGSTVKRNALTPNEMSQLISSQNPESFTMVECAINDWIVIIQTRPDWAPLGQKRFIELVNNRYFDGAALFRAIDNFLVQFGLASSKVMRDKWAGRENNIADDPHVDIPFTRGIMSFAGSGKDTRGTQIFFTLAKLSTHLGKAAWEVPFAKVIYGDEALQSINTEYDDNVSQGQIWRDGYSYLQKEFPNLSYIEYCRTINENEMMYYTNSVLKKNENENILAEEKNNIEEWEYDAANETMFMLQMVAAVIGIGACIFIVIKLLKKNPDKKR